MWIRNALTCKEPCPPDHYQMINLNVYIVLNIKCWVFIWSAEWWFIFFSSYITIMDKVFTCFYWLLINFTDHVWEVGPGGNQKDKRHFLPSVLSAAQWKQHSEGQSASAGEPTQNHDWKLWKCQDVERKRPEWLPGAVWAEWDDLHLEAIRGVKSKNRRGVRESHWSITCCWATEWTRCWWVIRRKSMCVVGAGCRMTSWVLKKSTIYNHRINPRINMTFKVKTVYWSSLSNTGFSINSFMVKS